jgi:uncharacterized membrane protein YesL
MGFLEIISRQHNLKEGAGKPYPVEGAAFFFALIRTHFWVFIKLNLLFTVFCIPIITIPSAIAGINRVLILLIRNGHCFLWSDFWEEFRRSFFRSLKIGLVMTIGLGISYYLLNFGIENLQSFSGLLGLVLGFWGTAFFCLFSAWTFVLTAMLDLNIGALLKNARILMLLEWRQNLVVMIVFVVAFCFILAVFPFSLPIYFLLLVSFAQYIICYFLNGPVQKHIIKSFEEKQKAG